MYIYMYAYIYIHIYMQTFSLVPMSYAISPQDLKCPFDVKLLINSHRAVEDKSLSSISRL